MVSGIVVNAIILDLLAILYATTICCQCKKTKRNICNHSTVKKQLSTITGV